MSIFVEQVPDDMPEEWQAYFKRMFVQIVNDSEQKGAIPPVTIVPAKPVAGKIYYFSAQVLPSIIWPGWWGWDGTEWVPIDSRKMSLAAYGGIVQSLTPALPDITATWQTIPFNADGLTTPVGVTQDWANDKLILPYKGIYQFNVYLSISHNEQNGSREMQVAYYSPSNAFRSNPVIVGVGRNIGVTNISIGLLFEVASNSTGNDFQIQINSASDTFTTVVLEVARFDANMEGEEQLSG